MRLFKEEGKVQRAKFYPRIIPLTNFLTNVQPPIKNKWMYFQLHGIQQRSSENKSAILKKLLFLFSCSDRKAKNKPTIIIK